MKTSSVVLFSGGLDSSVCLGAACQHEPDTRVLGLRFNYGQSHDLPEDQLKLLGDRISRRFNCFFDLHVYDLAAAFASNPLTDKNARPDPKQTTPTTFVPARNLVFLSLAIAQAARVGAEKVYIGVHANSEYPDCKEEFLTCLGITSRMALPDHRVAIATPLIKLDKAGIFNLAYALGLLDVVVQETKTCYTNSEERHQWGWGCGTCGACRLRQEGYAIFHGSQHVNNITVPGKAG